MAQGVNRVLDDELGVVGIGTKATRF